MKKPTWEDARAALDAGALGRTPAYNKKRRGSLGKIAKHLFGVDRKNLSALDADLAAFDATCGVGKVKVLPEGFDNADWYLKARSEARTILEAFLALQAPARRRPSQDGWSTLRTQLVLLAEPGPDGEKPLFHENKLIPFDVLAGDARDAALTPDALDGTWITERMAAATTAGHRNALRDAVLLLERARPHLDPAAAALLPAAPVAIPMVISSRRITPDLPPQLGASINAWLAQKARGRGLTGIKRRPVDPVSAETVKAARNGARWYVTVLAMLAGRPDAPFHGLDLAADPAPSLIARAAWLEWCVLQEINGETPWDELRPSTLANYVKATVNWLLVDAPDLAPERNRILSDPFFDDVGEMTPEIREWCKAFLRSQTRQIAFFDLPNVLQAKAEALFARYDALSETQKAQAVNLAIAAAMAAIITSFPLRSESLQQLRAFGRKRHLLFPTGPDKRDTIEIHLPPHFVKNNEPIDHPIGPKPPVHPRQVLEWFLGRPRDLLLKHHIRIETPDPNKLFCGLGYHRLHRAWTAATRLAGVPMTQHKARHATASFLLNADSANLPLVCALLKITEATARRNYVFIDQRRLAAESDRALANSVAALRGRRRAA